MQVAAGDSADSPIGAAEFAALLDALGPFEPAPLLAVGVSGGADSLALVLLADRWARARRGSVLALTVDHGLRDGSAAEAAQVGRWLAARGIAHDILRWEGPKPATAIQEKAREARYRLLGARCAGAGILHLLLAHHLDDQAETVLLRRAHGSGRDGLAGMAAIRETDQLRLLRPLLGLAKRRLQASCKAAAQEWIEDPSNRSFARGQLRSGAAIDCAGVAAQARADAEARRDAEREVAHFLARAATAQPEGYVTLDAAGFDAAPDALADRALARCLLAVGGGGFSPNRGRVAALRQALRSPSVVEGRDTSAAWTLAGCRVWRRRYAVLVAREEARVQDQRELPAGGAVRWDGRFDVKRGRDHAGRNITLARLGQAGWRQLVAERPDFERHWLPGPVRNCLPALWQEGAVWCVPHLSYVSALAPGLGCLATFRPAQPLAGAAFSVVSAPAVII